MILMLHFRPTLIAAALLMASLVPACKAQDRPASSAAVALSRALPSPPTDAALSGNEAWQKLVAGNERFMHGRCTHPDQDGTRRAQLGVGQHPFATILSCSDSRVPPEVIFDQGLGDLFVVRVAGNVVDDDVLGTLEYAVEHLHCPLIVVLGHSQCGAVTAAVSGERVSGHLRAIIQALKPAVDSSRGHGGNRVEAAVEANVRRVVRELEASRPVLHEHIEAGTLKVIGARYELVTGKVQALP